MDQNNSKYRHFSSSVNLVVLNHWCYTHPNKSEHKFCCYKPLITFITKNRNINLVVTNQYSKVVATVEIIIVQIWMQHRQVKSAITEAFVAISWGAPVTTSNNLQPCLYFHPKLTSKSPHLTGIRSTAEAGDMGTTLLPSISQNSFLPSLKYYYLLFEKK